MKLLAFKGKSGMLDFYSAMMNTEELTAVFTPFFEKAEAAIKSGQDNAFSRAQRLLDMPHVRKIVSYLSREIRFCASPSAACVVKETLIDASRNLYEIEINDAYLFDGQKRTKAYMLEREKNPDFNDHLSVLIVNTDELHVIQQLFTDNNNTAAKVSNSLSMIYDHQNPLSKFIPSIVPAKLDLLEVDKATISKTSERLLTPKIMQEGISLIFNLTPATLEQLEYQKLVDGWDKYHPYVRKLFEVYHVLRESYTFTLLREQSILPHNVTFLALMKLIPMAKKQGLPPSFLDKLHDLHHDGSTNRTNPVWEGRCLWMGSLKKTGISIARTAAMLGYLLNVELDDSLSMLVDSGLKNDDLNINMMD